MDSDEGLSIGQMFYMIAYQDWRPETPPDCPPGYVDLMTSCWHEDPEQRPTAQQLLKRLQKLQGQARQESMSARKARAAAADEDSLMQAAQIDSAASESEASTAAKQLHYLRMLEVNRDGAGAAGSQTLHSSPAYADQHSQHMDAMQVAQPAGLLGTPCSQPAVLGNQLAAPTASPTAADLAAALAAWQERQAAHGQFPASAGTSTHAAAVSLPPVYPQPLSTWGHSQEYPHTAGASASSLDITGLGVFGGSYAGVLPAADGLSGAELQDWQYDTTVIHPVDLGFVNTYGEGFAGCLPAYCSSDEDGGSALEPYIAALDAALAEKAAGRLRLPS
jgi:hypothetical protein